jgi:hypothetical protein
MAATNRQIVERYMRAITTDQAMVRELRHRDFVEEWPQSGERVRGADRMDEINAQYPGGMPKGDLTGVVGSEDRWVMSPSLTLVRLVGEGDTFTAQARAEYADGSKWYVVSVIEVRNAKIARATTYFAPVLPAPEWRANLVERMES